jgi:glycosyltransferase involved in cell wall biosynthesis
MARMTTHIIAISDQQAKALKEVYKIAPPEKISVVYLGIDKSFCDGTLMENALEIKDQFKFSNETVSIGIIGRIVAIKNCELFANIVKLLLSREENRNVKFFVVGDGKEKEKLQHDLATRNIKWSTVENHFEDASVIFTSWVSSVSKILKGLDIVMLTSKNEGTPLSLIEAQFCGKPVVATDAGGVRDTFVDNETGFLIRQNDIDMFVNKLSLLIKDKALREDMGKKAKIFATQKFSKEAEVENIRKLYNGCKTEASL